MSLWLYATHHHHPPPRPVCLSIWVPNSTTSFAIHQSRPCIILNDDDICKCSFVQTMQLFCTAITLTIPLSFSLSLTLYLSIFRIITTLRLWCGHFIWTFTGSLTPPPSLHPSHWVINNLITRTHSGRPQTMYGLGDLGFHFTGRYKYKYVVCCDKTGFL